MFVVPHFCSSLQLSFITVPFLPPSLPRGSVSSGGEGEGRGEGVSRRRSRQRPASSPHYNPPHAPALELPPRGGGGSNPPPRPPDYYTQVLPATCYLLPSYSCHLPPPLPPAGLLSRRAGEQGEPDPEQGQWGEGGGGDPGVCGLSTGGRLAAPFDPGLLPNERIPSTKWPSLDLPKRNLVQTRKG